ncbi:MAG: hypothetical protein ACI9Y1_000165 [Lentisphaeria bacterium]|jgi:hypothetical protein
MPTETERRNNERIHHRGYGTLLSGDAAMPVHLINLSVRGALVAILDDFNLNTDDTITLRIVFEDGHAAEMNGRVAHIKEHFIGLQCEPVSEQDKSLIRSAIESFDCATWNP